MFNCVFHNGEFVFHGSFLPSTRKEGPETEYGTWNEPVAVVTGAVANQRLRGPKPVPLPREALEPGPRNGPTPPLRGPGAQGSRTGPPMPQTTFPVPSRYAPPPLLQLSPTLRLLPTSPSI